jgi:chlorite dismutase
VERLTAPRGAPLPPVAALRKIEAPEFAPLEGATWGLQGVRSNERYVEKREHVQLAAIQAGLGRPESSCAALLPMSKSKAWWELSQDERRAILEERSGHIAKGSRYLPAIARRLFHGRDLGAEFDFLTRFEFSPADREAFESLLGELRRTEEWQYVEREVDVRLVRTP